MADPVLSTSAGFATALKLQKCKVIQGIDKTLDRQQLLADGLHQVAPGSL